MGVAMENATGGVKAAAILSLERSQARWGGALPFKNYVFDE